MTEYKHGRYNAAFREGATSVEFDVGDRVIVDPGLRTCTKGVEVVTDMLKYAGRKAVIKSKSRVAYRLDINGFSWQDYMLISDMPEIDEAAFQRLLMQ